MKSLKYLLIGIISLCYSCTPQIEPPTPVGPLPTARQLVWQEMEYYGFLHFNMNTFTNIEWGEGSEKPSQFNPSELDAMQWARIAKEAGMKGLIITAKHHDGFCLWPSKYTEHSVKNSSWKNGKGDVIKELSEACKAYGIKMGVYLSPWDRNHADYGKPEYVTVFHNQLRELLTNYGDIFEVWFDGANGGSGYYGGANETRKIDNKTYYQWDKAISIVRELQPNAVIFGDGGPGVRWVGNEEGWANETNWSLIRDEVHIGYPKYKELRSGHEDGTNWVPAECDVSIRPGWYYHPYEDHKVKSLPHLLNIYYQSVGRNASLLLNLPIDNRGLVHENDEKQLMALKNQLEADFEVNLAEGQNITATDTRGNNSNYGVANLNDGNQETYWATNDSVIKASITMEFDSPTAMNRILLQEYIPLGQRVKNFTVEAEIEGEWKEIDRQTTIGYKRILRFSTVTVSKIKVSIIDAKGPPLLSNIEIYNAPKLLVAPILKRDKSGMLDIVKADESVDIYYTLDGSEPVISSKKFETPFLVEEPLVIKAIAYDDITKKSSEVTSQNFDISRKAWNIIAVSSGDISSADKMIDGDPNTSWSITGEEEPSQFVTVDLGKDYTLNGFTYLPMQDRWIKGVITNYEFLVSVDNKTWQKVVEGEFGNIWNNPIEQKIEFNPVKGRYFKIKATKIHGEENVACFAEIGIITK
jgi:alpha-L-fucosidase